MIKVFKLILVTFVIVFSVISANAQKVSAVEAMQMIKDSSDIIILDVRTTGEYSEGHIENSILIDYKDNSFKEKLDSLNKGKTYIVYCRSGNRSRMAQTLMKENGFEKVYNLEDGIIGWKEEAYPLVK